MKGISDNKKAIDIFSGCGGLTLGLKQAGFNVIGAVEINELAVETYKANHPDVEIWENDIREVDIAEMRRDLGIRKGELTLLAGCPPCQGFSSIRTLNRNKEIDDHRNDLVYEYIRFVKGFQPRFIMFENVPGLVKDVRFLDLKRELRKLGYELDSDVLDAADFGVPQRRKRVIIIGAKRQQIELNRKNRRRKNLKSTIKRMRKPGNGDDPLHDYQTDRTERIERLIAKIPKNGGSRTDLPQEDQLECHKKCDGFKDIYGRMSWDSVAPTITGGCINPSKGRFLHPDQDRAITLREAALLQSFPDDYYFSMSRGRFAVADMIGNALPPRFIKAICGTFKSNLQKGC